jgi:hypothetical protein
MTSCILYHTIHSVAPGNIGGRVQRGRFGNQKSYSRLKIENLQSNVTEHYPSTLMLMFEVAVAGRLHPVLRVMLFKSMACELRD